MWVLLFGWRPSSLVLWCLVGDLLVRVLHRGRVLLRSFWSESKTAVVVVSLFGELNRAVRHV